MSIETAGNVDPRGLAACESLVRDRLVASVRYDATIPSTSALAMLDLEQGPSFAMPRLYVADQQTGGQGRHGKRWLSDNGTLTMTIVVRAPKNLAILSLAIGIAIVETVDAAVSPDRVGLKWPNDVRIGDKKVAGVLIQSLLRRRGIAIGVGLNVATRFAATDPLARSATSIALASGIDTHRYDWLASCVRAILRWVEFANTDPQGIIDSYRPRCVLAGHAVDYFVGGDRMSGRCEGVDDDGALRVRQDGVIRRLVSGEVERVSTIE